MKIEGANGDARRVALANKASGSGHPNLTISAEIRLFSARLIGGRSPAIARLAAASPWRWGHGARILSDSTLYAIMEKDCGRGEAGQGSAVAPNAKRRWPP